MFRKKICPLNKISEKNHQVFQIIEQLFAIILIINDDNNETKHYNATLMEGIIHKMQTVVKNTKETQQTVTVTNCIRLQNILISKHFTLVNHKTVSCTFIYI